eukprot:gene12850-14172_t
MADLDRVALPPDAANNAMNDQVIPGRTGNLSDTTTSAPNTGTEASSRPNAIMTGKLPDGFLRLDAPQVVQGAYPAYVSAGNPFMPTYYQQGGILTVTIIQARLAKNYGLSRMDPYCRIRLGNSVYETPTAYNGAKNPRWNKTFSLPLPEGRNDMYLEMFDECSFSPDERIAWGLINIKDEVFAGEFVDDWYSLSGKQGDEKEGMINITMKYKVSPIPAPAPVYMPQVPMMMPYGAAMPYIYPQGMVPAVTLAQPGVAAPRPQQPAPPQQPAFSESDLKTLKEMFPSMDEEIVKSVLVNCGGNLDSAAANLLSMSDP